MRIEELVNKINSSVDELDFVTARTFLEQNSEILEDYKSLLNHNARELLHLVQNNLNSSHTQPTREEMAIIKTINSYAAIFDLKGIKYVLKGKPNLFFQKDISYYLNKDARAILEGMGAIPKS